MDESGGELKIISAEDVAKDAKGAAGHKKDTNTKHSIARFNKSQAPLNEKGELSTEPGDSKANNMEPFHPAETNAAGQSVRYEELTDQILNTPDPAEKKALEEIRDSLKIEKLDKIPSATGITEQGDFVRKIPPTQEYKDPETKQVFRYVLYNWDKRREGEPITVSFPPYNTRTDKNSTQSIRDAELAAQMSDRPMISIMHPGMGSDALTKKQRRELETDQSYFSIADAQIKLLKSIGIGKDDSVDVAGSSMGAFAGLAFAARSTEEDFKLNRLVLTSLPGVEDRDPTELRKAMQATNPNLPAAWSSPFSPDMYEAGFLNKSGFRQLLEGAKWVGRVVVNDPAIHGFPYWNALTKDTAADRMLQVLGKHTDSSVVLVAGMEDMVSRKDAVYSTLDIVREHGYGKDRAAGVFLPGEKHDVGENSIRNAGTVRDALLAKHKKPILDNQQKAA